MVTATVPLQQPPPLTADEYYAQAARLGLDEDARIELLDGELVPLAPINDPHAGCVNRLTRLFVRRFDGETAIVAVQNPARVSELDVPQPDIAILLPRADAYATRTPTPADVLLLVKVADHTVRTDLGRKARIYADGGIREYWVVDLNRERLHIHRGPVTGGYAERKAHGRGDTLTPRFAPDVVIRVEEILG